MKGDNKSHEQFKKAVIDNLSNLEAETLTKTINNISCYITNRVARRLAERNNSNIFPAVKTDCLDCSVKEFYEQDYLKEQYGSFEELKEKCYGESATDFIKKYNDANNAGSPEVRSESKKKTANKGLVVRLKKDIEKLFDGDGVTAKQVKDKNKKKFTKLKEIIEAINTERQIEEIVEPPKKKVAKKAKKRVVKKTAKTSKNVTAIKKVVKKVAKKKGKE